MMSIIILVGVYRYYAGLAERFGKTKWHFGLLAIGIYLVFQLLFLFSYETYVAFTDPNSLDNNYVGFSGINIISWLFAIGVVYGIYRLLENKFKKENIENPVLKIEEIGTERTKDIP